MSTLNVESISHPTPGSNVTVNGITPASTNSLGLRNLVINGAMQVAQRGNSISQAQTVGYTLDRWKYHTGACDTYTCTVTKSSTAPADFTSSLQLTTGTTESLDANEFIYISQTIEAQNLQHLQFGTAGAQNITLSFWVRSSQTGTFGVNIYQDDGSGLINSSYTINSADTWERKTITFPGNTTGSIANDNGQGLQISWILGVGSQYSGTSQTTWGSYSDAAWGGDHAQNGVVTTASATWYITGVQLEVGSVATPFEHRSYGDELLRCQRYYYRMTSTAPYTQFAFCNVQSATVHKPFFHFPVSLRVPPTAVEHSSLCIITAFGLGVTPLSGLTLDANLNGTESTTLSATVASPGLGSGGATTVLLANNTGTASIAFLAEL